MAAQPVKSPKKRSRQARRVKATRGKLKDAARAVFAEKGLDVPSIDEITERADVGKGTFYYHYDDKDDLVREMVEEMLAELRGEIARQCEGLTDLRKVLDTLIGAHIDFFSSRWEDFVLYFQGRADLKLQEGYAGLERPFREYLEEIETLLESVIQYDLSPTHLRRIACVVAGFVSGYYSFATIASDEEDDDGAFQALRGAMVSSLARFVREAVPHKPQ